MSEESNKTTDKIYALQATETRLQRWALVAEIIGGIAIIVSLIFVGYQVRQSTKEAELNRNAL